MVSTLSEALPCSVTAFFMMDQYVYQFNPLCQALTCLSYLLTTCTPLVSIIFRLISARPQYRYDIHQLRLDLVPQLCCELMISSIVVLSTFWRHIPDLLCSCLNDRRRKDNTASGAFPLDRSDKIINCSVAFHLIGSFRSLSTSSIMPQGLICYIDAVHYIRYVVSIAVVSDIPFLWCFSISFL